MKLWKVSLICGLLWEITLFLGLFLGIVLGPKEQPVPWVIWAYHYTHYPAIWLVEHGVPEPVNVVPGIAMAVLVWTLFFYGLLWGIKKVFKRQ